MQIDKTCREFGDNCWQFKLFRKTLGHNWTSSYFLNKFIFAYALGFSKLFGLTRDFSEFFRYTQKSLESRTSAEFFVFNRIFFCVFSKFFGHPQNSSINASYSNLSGFFGIPWNLSYFFGFHRNCSWILGIPGNSSEPRNSLDYRELPQNSSHYLVDIQNFFEFFELHQIPQTSVKLFGHTPTSAIN